MRRLGWRVIIAGALAATLVGCASAPEPKEKDALIRNRLVGQTREAVFACAGPPLRERMQQTLTILRYYREAPLLEESFSGTKGSQPRPHHGCWAELVVKDNRIADVHYVSVPANVDSSDHCDQIFGNCTF